MFNANGLVDETDIDGTGEPSWVEQAEPYGEPCGGPYGLPPAYTVGANTVAVARKRRRDAMMSFNGKGRRRFA